MLKEIFIEEYLALANELPLVDVRSPGEYYKGHIPESINIPLFSDEERARVGTMYVQQSREGAIELAYKLVEPKRQWFIDEASDKKVNNSIAVHCWRGGMRSKAFAEYIEASGIKNVFIIKHGYKAFRKLVLKTFEKDFQLRILGGYTGSGKTEILKQLKMLGEQVVDLEELAHHKGSVFGGMGKRIELSTEQFENDLFWQWKNLDFKKPIWLEDESASIGPVHLPANLFRKMREAKLVFLEIPKTKRAAFLVDDYKTCNKEVLVQNVQKITKKLGGQNAQEAIRLIEKDNYYEAAIILLQYYDKYYLKGLAKRDTEKVVHLTAASIDHKKNARKVKDTFKN